jgi:hypothetical protein
LSYRSGAGNSIAGTGWALEGLPVIGLDTREGTPRYDGQDPVAHNGHTRIVPELTPDGVPRVEDGPNHRLYFYVSRFGHGTLRYERWVHRPTGEVHWRTRDRDDVVTVFGRSASHRLADPSDPSRVFQWLAESIHDPTGNAARFTYAAEGAAGADVAAPFETARLQRGLFAQQYPKRIRYGNTIPLGPDEPPPDDGIWAFEVVFDYGDHADGPHPEPDRVWPVRADAFSTGQAGFDVRTYRLLTRVLMFHRFAATGSDPVCVGLTRLSYNEHPAGSTLVSIDYEGRRREDGTVAIRTLAPLRFTYSDPEPAEQFTPLEGEAVENVPGGLTGSHRCVDLHGEGLPGILTEAHGTWYYKPNRG